STVNFLCNKRHIGVQQLQGIAQNCLQSPESCPFGAVCIAVKPWLHHLNIPVAEFFPDEIIYFLNSNAQFIFVHVFCHIFCQSIDFGQNPLICSCKFCKVHFSRNFCFFQVHHNKSGSIPYLIGKVSAGFYSLPVETHIISRSISCDQSKSQCVCTILVDNLQR